MNWALICPPNPITTARVDHENEFEHEKQSDSNRYFGHSSAGFISRLLLPPRPVPSSRDRRAHGRADNDGRTDRCE